MDNWGVWAHRMLGLMADANDQYAEEGGYTEHTTQRPMTVGVIMGQQFREHLNASTFLTSW